MNPVIDSVGSVFEQKISFSKEGNVTTASALECYFFVGLFMRIHIQESL